MHTSKESKLEHPLRSLNLVTTPNPLELMHMHLCRPMPIRNKKGSTYVFVIFYDFSRFAQVQKKKLRNLKNS